MPGVMMSMKRPPVTDSIWVYSSWLRKYMVVGVVRKNTVAAIFLHESLPICFCSILKIVSVEKVDSLIELYIILPAHSLL